MIKEGNMNINLIDNSNLNLQPQAQLVKVALFLDIDDTILKTMSIEKKWGCCCYDTEQIAEVINEQTFGEINKFALKNNVPIYLITSRNLRYKRPLNAHNAQMKFIFENAGGLSKKTEIGGFKYNRCYSIPSAQTKPDKTAKIEEIFKSLLKRHPEIRRSDCCFVDDLLMHIKHINKFNQKFQDPKDQYNVIQSDKNGVHFESVLKFLNEKCSKGAINTPEELVKEEAEIVI